MCEQTYPAPERSDNAVYSVPTEKEACMPEDPHIPRRYVTIRGKRATAEVWNSIPGRENEEIWLKGVRPIVKLAGKEGESTHSLMGRIHAALSEVGLRRRAQRFVMRAYYLGSYDDVLRLAKDYVEFE